MKKNKSDLKNDYRCEVRYVNKKMFPKPKDTCQICGYPKLHNARLCANCGNCLVC